MALSHASNDIDPRATIGPRTKIWPFATVREHAVVGEGCMIGRGAYVDREVHVGNNVRIQNGAQIFWPAVIGDDVFIGPNAVLTNDKNPRAGLPHAWMAEGVIVNDGASIGAGAVILAGVEIGEGAVIGAGAVVTHDVPPGATWVGNPAHDIRAVLVMQSFQ